MAIEQTPQVSGRWLLSRNYPGQAGKNNAPSNAHLSNIEVDAGLFLAFGGTNAADPNTYHSLRPRNKLCESNNGVQDQ